MLQEDEEDEEVEKTITSGQAADMLEECLKWYEQQKEATPSEGFSMQKKVH